MCATRHDHILPQDLATSRTKMNHVTSWWRSLLIMEDGGVLWFWGRWLTQYLPHIYLMLASFNQLCSGLVFPRTPHTQWTSLHKHHEPRAPSTNVGHTYRFVEAHPTLCPTLLNTLNELKFHEDHFKSLNALGTWTLGLISNKSERQVKANPKDGCTVILF